MEDRKAEHLIEVWLHELQDHANLISNLPTLSSLDRLRSAYYEGFSLGLNNDAAWLERRSASIVVPTPLEVARQMVAILGFTEARKWRDKVVAEDRDIYRQRMYEKLKEQMSKITPWTDQARKPL